MINEEHADQLMGRDMLDQEGIRIGEITQVFIDDRTGEPTWVTVKTGWFGLSQSFVPLNKVQWAGEQVRAAYDTATVKDAPRFATDEPLTVQDEDTLHTHYGLSDAATQLPRQPRPGDPDTDPHDVTTGNAQAFVAGSRGRLRRYEPPTQRSVAGPTALGGAAVCERCGGYIAAGMRTVHDTFHDRVAQPTGSYARHDIQITEPAAGAARPNGGYALRDVDTTTPVVASPAASTR